MMKPISEYAVSELMQKEIQTVREATTLLEAVHKMAEKKVSYLIVEKEHDKDAYGILTCKDVVNEVAENWESLTTLKVGDLASKPIVTIPAGVGIKHAVRLMRLSGVRRIGVLDGDKLVGILSNSDVLHEIEKFKPS